MELDFLETLLNEPTEVDSKGFPPPQQFGPLRYFDKTDACLSTFTTSEENRKKGHKCGSPTHYKLHGIRTCMTHALMQMNHELYELGVEK